MGQHCSGGRRWRGWTASDWAWWPRCGRPRKSGTRGGRGACPMPRAVTVLAAVLRRMDPRERDRQGRGPRRGRHALGGGRLVAQPAAGPGVLKKAERGLGRRPRNSGHSVRSCAPSGVGNHPQPRRHGGFNRAVEGMFLAAPVLTEWPRCALHLTSFRRAVLQELPGVARCALLLLGHLAVEAYVEGSGNGTLLCPDPLAHATVSSVSGAPPPRLGNTDLPRRSPIRPS